MNNFSPQMRSVLAVALKRASRYPVCVLGVIVVGTIAVATTTFGQVYRFQGRLTTQQLNEEEGLRARLSSANDTVRVEILDSLAWLYRGTDFERAMHYVQQAAREVERLGFPRVRAENQNYMGIIYRNLGNYPQAMRCFVEARRIAEQYGYAREQGYALNNIGDIYRYEGNYTDARRFVMQSLQHFKNLRDTSGLYYCAIRLGEITRSMRELSLSLTHFHDALNYAQAFRDKVWETGALNRIGQVYHLQGDHAKALEAFGSALQISMRLPHNEDEQSSILIEIGKTYYSQHKADSATVVLQRGLHLAEMIGLKQQIREASRMLAEMYTEKRQFEKALQYRNRHLAMNDSLYTEIGRREIEKISAKYELEKQQDAIRTLDETQQRERMIGLSLAVGVVVLLVVVWLLYRYARAERRAHTEILRQQEILEHQSVEIESANTALLEQNAALAALNSEKTELMNIVAHDLKNPIAAVHGLADLMSSGNVREDYFRETAAQIVLTAERMLKLVTNILDSNRFDDGLATLQCVALDILPIVEATCWQYQAAAEAKKITLHYEPRVDAALALADEQAVMQVTENLLSNAVKYSPLGKKIIVRVHANDEKVYIEVQDEGPGISEEDMKKMFGKFARLSAQPTGGEHSTGLGLSIVKTMVEAMNGRVWCESELGKGATFMVELPKAS
jgi:signal transduction histidine kinase